MKTFDSQELERLIKGHCKGELDSVRIHDFIRQFTAVDRNQAYTRLVEGIEGMKEERDGGAYSTQLEKQVHDRKVFLYNQALTDIIEKVVKPLYGKK